MADVISTSDYARVILIDTQVVLETKPLEQLPWSELGQGPILLLVARQVQSEIDAKKSDGRLGERSRAFNRLLDAFLETGVPAALRSEGPKVDVALMRNSAIDWTHLDDLDRDDGDDRIVAQALNALVDDRSRMEVLSHDMRPRDAARSHGIAAIKLPEHWLRPPAQTPEQREVARLRQQLSIATADQPRLEVELAAVGETPWTRWTIDAPTEAEAATVYSALRRKHPRPHEGGWQFTHVDYDPDLANRHDRWSRRIQTKDLPIMHLGLSRLLSQRRMRIVVRNVGPIPAEGLAVELRSGNARLYADPYLVRIFGEPPPRRESPVARMSRMGGGSLRSPRRDQPFEVYREVEEPGALLSWSCRSFRQEREVVIEVSIELEDRTGTVAQIEVVVTASNLKGDVRAQTIAPVEQRHETFAGAFDGERGALRILPVYTPSARDGDDEITTIDNDGAVAD